MTEAERLAQALQKAVLEEDAEDDVVMVARWFVEDSAKELRRLLSESLRIESLHAQAKRELFDANQLNKELVEALETAYLAGFNASGEGYNGEYPFQNCDTSPEKDSDWLENRDIAIKKIKAKQ